MKKIATLLSLSFVMTMVPVIAQDMTVPSESTKRTFDEAVRDYNFEAPSYYTDETQTKDTEVSNKVQEEKPSFWAQVIDSSHFSSKTATKTYQPLNKAK